MNIRRKAEAPSVMFLFIRPFVHSMIWRYESIPKMNLYSKEDEERGIGSSLSYMSFGLRS
jgi:hypothetical protein